MSQTLMHERVPRVHFPIPARKLACINRRHVPNKKASELRYMDFYGIWTADSRRHTGNAFQPQHSTPEHRELAPLVLLFPNPTPSTMQSPACIHPFSVPPDSADESSLA